MWSRRSQIDPYACVGRREGVRYSLYWEYFEYKRSSFVSFSFFPPPRLGTMERIRIGDVGT